MQPTVVYLDTNQVLDVVLVGKMYSETMRMFSKLEKNVYRVVIPQIVIGETVAKIIQKCPDAVSFADCMSRLYRLLYRFGIDPEKCLEPLRPGVGKIMDDLGGDDEYLKGNDLALAAQVLADPDSARLITRDSVILNNAAILAYERKMHERDQRLAQLKITYTL